MIDETFRKGHLYFSLNEMNYKKLIDELREDFRDDFTDEFRN